MKTELIYRHATAADIAPVSGLVHLSYSRFYPSLSSENREQWSRSMRDHETYSDLLRIGTGFVCERNGSIIGTGFFIPHGNPNALFSEKWAYIRLVAVHPDEGGKGIGKAITRMCIDMARKGGERTLALHTSEFQHAARHIYEGLGFSKQQQFLLYDKTYWIYTLDLVE